LISSSEWDPIGDWYLKQYADKTLADASSSCSASGGQLAIIYDEVTHNALYRLTGISL